MPTKSVHPSIMIVFIFLSYCIYHALHVRSRQEPPYATSATPSVINKNRSRIISRHKGVLCRGCSSPVAIHDPSLHIRWPILDTNEWQPERTNQSLIFSCKCNKAISSYKLFISGE